MNNITKLVDNRIEWLKNERVKLESLRDDLFQKEASLIKREEELDKGYSTTLEHKKDVLMAEIAEAEEKLIKLKENDVVLLKEYGIDIENIHDEIVTTKEREASELQERINNLNQIRNKKTDEIDTLVKEMDDLTNQRDDDLRRLQEEKDSYISTLQTTKEIEIQELSQRYNQILESLEQQKETIQEEVSRMEEVRLAEREKIEAELDEIKKNQLSELAVAKEQAMADIEQLKTAAKQNLQDDLLQRTDELKELSERKSVLLEEIGLVKNKLDTTRTEIKTETEKIRNEYLFEFEEHKQKKLNELEALLLFRLQDSEEQRINRIKEFEDEIFRKSEELEAQRKQRTAKYQQAFDQTLLDIEKSREELSAIQTEHQSTVHEIEMIKEESVRIKAANEAALKKALIEQQSACEKIQADKMDEIEAATIVRLKQADEALQKKAAEYKDFENAHAEQVEALQKEKSAILSQLNDLKVSLADAQRQNADEYARMKIENIDAMSVLKQEKISEMEIYLENLRIEKIKNIDELWQRKQEEEEIHLEKMNAMIAARNEKLEERQNAIEAATRELERIYGERKNTEQENERLIIESKKFKAENDALIKKMVIERQIELENYRTEKMNEIETTCNLRLTQVKEQELAQNEQISVLRKTANNLLKQIENLKTEFNNEQNKLTSEMEKLKIEGMDDLTHYKLDKLNEIDIYLNTHRDKKINELHTEMKAQSDKNLKCFDDLREQYKEYEIKMRELADMSAAYDKDKRKLETREKLFDERQKDYEGILENERKEKELLIQAKDQQIAFLQEKLKSYINDLTTYREDMLSDGGKTKKELVKEMEFMQARINNQLTELQNRPTSAYVISLEEEIKDVEDLKKENKKLAMRVAGLERERHNWQMSAFIK